MSKYMILAENSNFSAADSYPDFPQTGLKSSKNSIKTFFKSSGNVQQCHKTLKNFIKPMKRNQRPTDRWTDGPTDRQSGLESRVHATTNRG